MFKSEANRFVEELIYSLCGYVYIIFLQLLSLTTLHAVYSDGNLESPIIVDIYTVELYSQRERHCTDMPL